MTTQQKHIDYLKRIFLEQYNLFIDGNISLDQLKTRTESQTNYWGGAIRILKGLNPAYPLEIKHKKYKKNTQW